MFLFASRRRELWSRDGRRRPAAAMSGSPATIAGMATLTAGAREGGKSLHARVPTGSRITGFTVGADGFWWKGTGDSVRWFSPRPHGATMIRLVFSAML